MDLCQLEEEITGPSHCLRHGKQLDIIGGAKPTGMPLLMDISPEPPSMPGRDGLQREGRFRRIADQSDSVWGASVHRSWLAHASVTGERMRVFSLGERFAIDIG